MKAECEFRIDGVALFGACQRQPCDAVINVESDGRTVHRAPAFSACRHARRMSSGSTATRPRACAEEALPRMTRPLMPWKMAASRTKLKEIGRASCGESGCRYV